MTRSTPVITQRSTSLKTELNGGKLLQKALPIENVWGSLKYYLRHEYKPTNLASLEDGIKNFWKTLTPQLCRKYISHLHTVIPKVIAANGAASGYKIFFLTAFIKATTSTKEFHLNKLI